MSSLTDRVIDSLTAHHERLAELLDGLDETALSGPSGATEWRLCDVLSHLGSGAEIVGRAIETATGTELPAVENREIWDRWDAATPRDQAEGFLHHDAHLVGMLRALTDEQRESLRIDLGFLPEPVTLEVAAGERLAEVALHTWDVFVGIDPDTLLDDLAAEILIELLAGPLGFMLGSIGKTDALREPAVVGMFGHGLAIVETVELVAAPPMAPTATFTGEPEAAVRLFGGRLRPEHTPEDVVVSGNIDLTDLRRVFPGF